MSARAITPKFSLGSTVRLKRNGQAFRIDHVEFNARNDGHVYSGRTPEGFYITATEVEIEGSRDPATVTQANGKEHKSFAQVAAEVTNQNPSLDISLVRDNDGPPAVLLSLVYPKLTVEYALFAQQVDETIAILKEFRAQM